MKDMKKVMFGLIAVLVATTACQKDPAAEISLGEDNASAQDYSVPAAGAEYEILVTANYAWTATIEGTCDVVVEPQQGKGGEKVVITVGENLSDNELASTVTFKAVGGDTEAVAPVSLKQGRLTSVEYGGVTYNVKKLADGNFWFVDNLRYVPEGKTVSDDLTAIDNGIWYPIDATAKALTNNADTVAKKGYLYNIEAALGVAAGTVKTENYLSFDGARGICPEGWHIPSLDDIAGLVGRVAVTKYDLKQDPGPIATAPYWNAEAGAALQSLAIADGFPMTKSYGYINATATATKGTIINVMSYIISSYGITKAADNTFNNQFAGIMIAATNGGSCSGAACNYRSGVVVRCVKDVKK